MTVYCPSCGKPNTDDAAKCVTCGGELKKQAPRPAAPAGGGKFKGTMMMGGGLGAPQAPGAPQQGAPPPAANPAAPTPPAGVAPVQPGALAPKKDMAFQATMLGPMVAPPGAPGAAPPAGAPAQPGPSSPFGAAAQQPPAGGGFGQPAAPAGGGFGGAVSGFGQTAPGVGFGQPAAPAGVGFGQPAAPAGGGFGAPVAPAGGGFGAPTAPAGGGFGQPAAPAGGGFGAPAAPAGGGFGAPAASGGAFGQPAAPTGGGFGAPAGGGFGGPAAPGGGAFAPAAPTGGEGKSKTWLFVLLGCGGLLFLSCVIGMFALYQFGQKAKEFGAGALDGVAEVQRPQVALLLDLVRTSCQMDPTGSAAALHFHPGTFPTLQGQVCQISEQTVAVFTDPQRSQARGLSGSGDEGLVTPHGIQPMSCSEYTAGSAKLVTCSLPQGFKIVHMENIGSAQ